MSLNLNNFRTVFSDNFGSDHSLNRGIWSSSWGSSSQYSFGNGALTLTGSSATGFKGVGFMQAPSGKSAGEGYGLYQFSGYANAGQGVGICFVMWRADNVWLDKSHPNVGTELDILESWDKTKSGASTIHYYKSGSSNNGQSAHSINVDLTKNHTYAMDWERGSLTFYVDGNEVYRDTSHVPLDAADGGSNEVMGAEVVNEKSTVQLHITGMSYSAPKSGSAVTSPTPTPAPTPAKGPVFITKSYSSATLTAGETLTDKGSHNTLVLPAAGGVTLSGNVLTNSDKFDLRAVMAKTSWDGKSSDLGKYLSKAVTNGGKDMQVLVHAKGGSASTVLATFTGDGAKAGMFTAFEQHSLLK